MKLLILVNNYDVILMMENHSFLNFLLLSGFQAGRKKNFDMFLIDEVKAQSYFWTRTERKKLTRKDGSCPGCQAKKT